MSKNDFIFIIRKGDSNFFIYFNNFLRECLNKKLKLLKYKKMLKSFKIFNSRTNCIVLKNINYNNNKLFKIANNFNFSSSHSHKDHENNDDHGGHHHEEPQDYHDLKFDRVSYNQKLSKEQRKP